MKIIPFNLNDGYTIRTYPVRAIEHFIEQPHRKQKHDKLGILPSNCVSD